jgi:hypothetical protein
MKEHLHLGNTNAVLLEIQKLVKKREFLETISRYKNFRNVRIMLSANDNIGVERMIFIDDENLPFLLSNEVENLLLDAIDEISRDISSLNLHLKNL